jgi:hypothetical protein
MLQLMGLEAVSSLRHPVPNLRPLVRNLLQRKRSPVSCSGFWASVMETQAQALAAWAPSESSPWQDRRCQV